MTLIPRKMILQRSKKKNYVNFYGIFGEVPEPQP